MRKVTELRSAIRVALMAEAGLFMLGERKLAEQMQDAVDTLIRLEQAT